VVNTTIVQTPAKAFSKDGLVMLQLIVHQVKVSGQTIEK